jgi:hypothetical protein
MRINYTKYNNDGELLAPNPSDLRKMNVFPGGQPTTDAGSYHQFKFEARTAAELDDKTRRFFNLMGDIPGYSTLSLRPYEVREGAYYRTGMDIIYVIETPCVGVR